MRREDPSQIFKDQENRQWQQKLGGLPYFVDKVTNAALLNYLAAKSAFKRQIIAISPHPMAASSGHQTDLDPRLRNVFSSSQAALKKIKPSTFSGKQKD